jgi:hypothetical protein
MSPQQFLHLSNSTTNWTSSFIQPQTRLNLARKIRNTHEMSKPRHFTTSPSLTTTSLTIAPKFDPSPHTVYKPRAVPTPLFPTTYSLGESTSNMPRNSKYYTNNINNNNTSYNYDRKRDVSPPNDPRYEYRSVSPVPSDQDVKATFRNLQGGSPGDWALPPDKF